MSEFIEIRDARENNLKDVSLRIPKRKITIFTGVSGSGKSSIVFDTIATEAQRQLYENFSLFIRNLLPRYPQPEADAIENLGMAVVVDQKRLGGGSHSTVGTITDIYTVLRLLYSRLRQPYVGYSNAFSFNDPQGMCPEYNGLGKKLGVASDDFLDLSKSLNERAVQVPFFASSEVGSYDEPSVGLHPRDVHRLNELLQKLRDKGNTVIVVEHDPDVIKVANHVVDVGPHAGSAGRQIVFEGSYADLLQADTLTARYLQRTLPIKQDVRQARVQLPIRNAGVNNLQDVSVDIPAGVLTVITGVAGSGKSSLVNEVFLRQHPQAIVIDQSAVGTSTRSNPATYTGVMDDVRRAFPAANKVDAGLFSFNSKGACESCKGSGVICTDLAFLDAVRTPCETCQGRRFKDEVLAFTLNGRSISDVLALTVAQALVFFTQPEIVRKLQAMSDVGLAYLALGQPLSTLSGGECQRIKLASELHKRGSIYVLDEPTTGLHMSDITHLLAIMNRLVDGGNTVIVIEHNLDVVRNADWIIDLGPEGGSKGGQVVFAGTPGEMLNATQSLTSRYLRGGAAL